MPLKQPFDFTTWSKIKCVGFGFRSRQIGGDPISYIPKNLEATGTLSRIDIVISSIHSTLCEAIISTMWARKIELNRLLWDGSSSNVLKRMREADQMKITEVIAEERESFCYLQHTFSNTRILHHFNLGKKLKIDLDSSRHGMGAIKNHSNIDPHTQKSVQPIMFLTRLLKSTEENYWSRNLEIAGFCWIISKIRHFIEFPKHSTIIFTIHQSDIQIVTKTSLTTISLVRLNPKHRRSSEYLLRLLFEVRYKTGRVNVVPTRFPDCKSAIYF